MDYEVRASSCYPYRCLVLPGPGYAEDYAYGYRLSALGFIDHVMPRSAPPLFRFRIKAADDFVDKEMAYN